MAIERAQAGFQKMFAVREMRIALAIGILLINRRFATTIPLGIAANLAFTLPKRGLRRREREQHHGKNRQMRQDLRNLARQKSRQCGLHERDFSRESAFDAGE